MPATMELFHCTQIDTSCQHLLKIIQKPKSHITVNENELICQNVSLDGLLQIVIPEALRHAVL